MHIHIAHGKTQVQAKNKRKHKDTHTHNISINANTTTATNTNSTPKHSTDNKKAPTPRSDCKGCGGGALRFKANQQHRPDKESHSTLKQCVNRSGFPILSSLPCACCGLALSARCGRCGWACGRRGQAGALWRVCWRYSDAQTNIVCALPWTVKKKRKEERS